MIRLAIRGYAAGVLQFEDLLEAGEDKLRELLPDLAQKHAEDLLEHRLHMIEIEFLDEPNPLERFFRFGSDPSGMVMPVMVILAKRRRMSYRENGDTITLEMSPEDYGHLLLMIGIADNAPWPEKLIFRDSEKGETITLEISRSAYDHLLIMMGMAAGKAHRDPDKTLFWSWIDLVNRLNAGNQRFIPYEIPEEFQPCRSPLN